LALALRGLRFFWFTVGSSLGGLVVGWWLGDREEDPVPGLCFGVCVVVAFFFFFFVVVTAVGWVAV
jgi:hypothetical protein